MMGQMWFGNRNQMVWVPCPAVGAGYGRSGSGVSSKLLNGGAFRRTTKSGAKTYSLTWNKTSRDNLRPITDFAEGVYGEGSIYWSDPFTMDKNALAQSFATPALGALDGVVLNGSDTRPDAVRTSANTNQYPTFSALYTVAPSDVPVRHWVPIPPGYVAWVGVHGVAGSGGAVIARPTTGPDTYGAAVTMPLLGVDTTTRVNQSFSGDTFTGVELYLGGSGTVTLSGMIVQVLPADAVPETGGFISGQGHSGCEFVDHPSIEAYSVAFDMVGASVEFEEVEQWR